MMKLAVTHPHIYLVELPIEGGHVAADPGPGVPAQVDLPINMT